MTNRRPTRRARVLIAVALAGALALSGCGYLADQAAASVRGRDIPLHQVQQALQTFKRTAQFKQLASQSSPEKAARQFEQGYLSNIVREKVIRYVAARRGMTVSRHQVEAQLQAIRRNYPNRKAFLQAVSQQGLTVAQLRRLIEDQLLQDELHRRVIARVSVSSDRVRAYYRSHLARFRQLHLAHIVFPANDFDRARSVARRLRSAPSARVPALFAKAAKRYSSERSSAAKGGDMGWVAVASLNPNVRFALENLGPGEVTQPVNTQNGFEVFRLLGKRTLSLQAARDRIEAQLGARAQQRAWARWMQERYRALKVTINPRFGTLDPRTLQIGDPAPEDLPNGAPTPFVPSGSPLPPLGP